LFFLRSVRGAFDKKTGQWFLTKVPESIFKIQSVRDF